MKEKKSKNSSGKRNTRTDWPDEWMSSADNQLNAAEWFGTIFIYLLLLGSRPFKELYSKKYKWRNVAIGYVLQLIVVGLFIYWLYSVYSQLPENYPLE